MPTLAALIDDAEDDVLACITFPAAQASGQRLVLGQQASEAKINETAANSCSEHSLTPFKRFHCRSADVRLHEPFGDVRASCERVVAGYP